MQAMQDQVCKLSEVSAAFWFYLAYLIRNPTLKLGASEDTTTM